MFALFIEWGDFTAGPVGLSFRHKRRMKPRYLLRLFRQLALALLLTVQRFSAAQLARHSVLKTGQLFVLATNAVSISVPSSELTVTGRQWDVRVEYIKCEASTDSQAVLVT